MDDAPAKRRYAVDTGAHNYERVLGALFDALAPKTYLEIGTNSGKSLTLSNCRSVAVDPKFKISSDVIGKKPECHFYQMGGDQFFTTYDVKSILGGPVDIAFLDGMHLYEFLLRDFINVEKICRNNSVVLMHDCIPSDIYMTTRAESNMEVRRHSVVPGWWTGDVWKVVPILKRFRPDLRMYAINTPPTGLIAVTNLDPASTILRDRYFEIVDLHAEGSQNEPDLEAYLRDLELINANEFMKFPDLAKRLWI